MNGEFRVAEVRSMECDAVLPGICDLYPVEVPEKEREALRSYAMDSGHVLLVARAEAVVVGFLAGSFPLTIDFAGRIARVDSLLVHIEWRRKAIATRLLGHFRLRARDHGCMHLVADVPCREGREAARLFWESHHLQESGLRQFSTPV